MEDGRFHGIPISLSRRTNVKLIASCVSVGSQRQIEPRITLLSRAGADDTDEEMSYEQLSSVVAEMHGLNEREHQPPDLDG